MESIISAVKLVNIQKVQELLDEGVDANSIDTGGDGFPVIILAAQKGNVEILKNLIDKGANIEKTTPKGNSPLIGAIYSNQHQCLKVLIERGANKNAKYYHSSGYQSPPIVLSSSKKHSECIRILIDSNVNINEVDTKGNNALMVSAFKGNLNCVHILLKTPIDINATNQNGYTALEIATVKQNFLCAREIKQRTRELTVHAVQAVHSDSVRSINQGETSPEILIGEHVPDTHTTPSRARLHNLRGMLSNGYTGDIGGPDTKGRPPS